MTRFKRSTRHLLATAAIAVLPLAWSATAVAAGDDASQAQNYDAEADKLLSKNDLRGAEIQMKNAVKAAPENGAYRLKLARMELSLNDVDGALVELKAAREHGADETKVIPLLGRIYLAQGKSDQILQEFPLHDEAPAPVRAATLVIRAEALIQLKRIDEAKAALVTAEQLAPQDAGPKLDLARIAFAQNQVDEALKKADEMLQIAPTADAHLVKGEILNKKGDHAGAVTEFDQAVKLEPNNIGGYLERAQTYIALKQDDKADADVKAALAINDRGVSANYLAALIAARKKDFAGADTILTKIAPAFPGFPRGYYLQAVVKSGLKQIEQAEQAVDAYLAAVPDDVNGEKVKADILLRKNNPSAAAEVLEKVTAQTPDDFQALTMLGQAYMQARKPQQAVEAFEKAQKLVPEDPSVLRGLALNHLATGQASAGTSELEKAIQVAPDDQPSSEALVLVYMRSKEFDKARALIDGMRKRRPDDPVPSSMSGMLELAQSHLPEAEAAYAETEKKFPDFVPAKLQLAYIYTVEGHMDKARDKYMAILAKDPSNSEALQSLSVLYKADNKFDEIVELWQKVHRAQPDDIPAALGLVQGYILKKDPETALSIVRDMQVRQPNEPRLYAMRAELELQKKDPKDAVVSLQRLAELRPQDSAVRSDLANAQRQAGDLPAATASIAEARKLDPSNIGLANQEIGILGEKNPDDGIAAAQRLAIQMPDQPLAQAVEGDYLTSLKRPQDAAAAYRKAFQAHPSLVLVQRLAGLAMQNGKPDEAGKLLNDWSAAHPDDVGAKVAVAGFVLGQKDWSGARQRYEAVLKDQPNNPLIMNNLAVIYQHDGDDAKALDLAQKAHSAAPQSPQVSDTLGWIMIQKTDVAKGLKFLQEAHAGAPDDPDVQYHLAVALDRTGKKPDAIELLKKAVGSGKEFDSKKDAEALLANLSKS